MIKVDRAKCQGCGACVNVCPQKAISLVNNIANIDGNKCVECAKCINVCPVKALSLERRNMDLPQTAKQPYVGKNFSGGQGFGRGRGRGRRRGAFR